MPQRQSGPADAWASEKTRHLDTSLLWIQERVRSGDVLLEKVPGSENPGDALTKHLLGPLLRSHLQRMGLVAEAGRAQSAPQLTTTVQPATEYMKKTFQIARDLDKQKREQMQKLHDTKSMITATLHAHFGQRKHDRPYRI